MAVFRKPIPAYLFARLSAICLSSLSLIIISKCHLIRQSVFFRISFLVKWGIVGGLVELLTGVSVSGVCSCPFPRVVSVFTSLHARSLFDFHNQGEGNLPALGLLCNLKIILESFMMFSPTFFPGQSYLLLLYTLQLCLAQKIHELSLCIHESSPILAALI